MVTEALFTPPETSSAAQRRLLDLNWDKDFSGDTGSQHGPDIVNRKLTH